MSRLIKKIKFETKIKVITGLHIGGGSENVEIGGIDTAVIKLGSKGNQPYIPGSSLKGKMRCLLEQAAGIAEIGGDDKGEAKEINNLFGIIKGDHVEKNHPSKLIVRDAMLTDESEEALRKCDNLDMPYTESKTENTIDRVDAQANPRTLERVPAGAEFQAQFIVNVWDDDEEKELISLFKDGIKLLQNDYLGGNGSRGYGQIEFGEWIRTDYCPDNDWNGESMESI